MSRLKKIANKSLNELIDIIDKWVEGYDINNNDINELINQNKDCLYSGTGYKTFHNEIIWNNFYNTLNNPPDDFDLYEDKENLQDVCNYMIDKQFILNYAKNIINESNNYCSFSKTKSAYEETKQGFSNVYDISNSIGIKCEIDGISVNMLIKKYKEQLEAMDSVALNLLHEDEIIAKMPSNFEIIEFLGMSIQSWPNNISLYDLKEKMSNYE